jgi:hypothetical protein
MFPATAKATAFIDSRRFTGYGVLHSAQQTHVTGYAVLRQHNKPMLRVTLSQTHVTGYAVLHSAQQTHVTGYTILLSAQQIHVTGYAALHPAQQTHVTGYAVLLSAQKTHVTDYAVLLSAQQTHVTGYAVLLSAQQTHVTGYAVLLSAQQTHVRNERIEMCRRVARCTTDVFACPIRRTSATAYACHRTGSRFYPQLGVWDFRTDKTEHIAWTTNVNKIFVFLHATAPW